jgi:UDP-N-acetylglucosamine acyltransferase
VKQVSKISVHGKASSFEEAFFDLKSSYIHPMSIIGSNVHIESNVKIGPFCTIQGKVKIKSGTRIFSNVAIGLPAQNLGTQRSLGSIEIGENCEIREFATIHSSKFESGKTIIGNSCYLMNYSHVGHDSILESNVTLINNVSLGGHTHVGKNTMIMGYAATHQFCKIGQSSVVAPYSATRQDLPPFCLFDGQPAKFAGLNLVGLRRQNLTQENIGGLKEVTKLFYKDKLLINDIIERIKQSSYQQDAYIQQFITFIKTSNRGVSRNSIFYKNQKE